ncbi:hypothetical protein [Leptospira meyeri]|uniref:hypothetical protein n=1 Tax=Leptospira meyeri TaxID=29508 RepID=UPI001083760A|nr:hypothetical protein [Leptospira meyeri]TGL12433.1 hypothetical protein EHQ50_11580 [Leptospira meyeri]
MLASLLTATQLLIGYQNVSYEYQGTQPYAWIEVGAIYQVHFGRDGWGNLICFDTVDLLGSIPCQCFVSGEWRVGQVDFVAWPWVGVSSDPVTAREYRPQPIPWIASGNVGLKTLAEWNSLQSDVSTGSKRNLVGTPVYG